MAQAIRTILDRIEQSNIDLTARNEYRDRPARRWRASVEEQEATRA